MVYEDDHDEVTPEQLQAGLDKHKQTTKDAQEAVKVCLSLACRTQMEREAKSMMYAATSSYKAQRRCCRLQCTQ